MEFREDKFVTQKGEFKIEPPKKTEDDDNVKFKSCTKQERTGGTSEDISEG